MTSANLWKGLVAGFAATVVLSALMIIKGATGLMPGLNVITMLSGFVGASSPAVGWIFHFIIGTVLWGGLFAWLDPNLPADSHWLKGVIFAIGAWLVMMIIVMPVAGAGFFAAHLGIGAAVATLVLHVIYGAVLGGVYGAEHPEETLQEA